MQFPLVMLPLAALGILLRIGLCSRFASALGRCGAVQVGNADMLNCYYAHANEPDDVRLQVLPWANFCASDAMWPVLLHAPWLGITGCVCANSVHTEKPFRNGQLPR